MGIYINNKVINENKERIDTQINTVKSIAGLEVENKKKDFMIGNLSKTIAGLNIEIQKLKGEK